FDRDRLIDDEHRIFQVIKDAGVLLPNERDKPFPPCEVFTFIGKDRAVAQAAREPFLTPAYARVRSPLPKIARGHEYFAHRGDFDLRKLRGGKLSFWIEFSNRINRVAKELDTRWSAI